jgi:hypothetical protein
MSDIADTPKIAVSITMEQSYREPDYGRVAEAMRAKSIVTIHYAGPNKIPIEFPVNRCSSLSDARSMTSHMLSQWASQTKNHLQHRLIYVSRVVLSLEENSISHAVVKMTSKVDTVKSFDIMLDGFDILAEAELNAVRSFASLLDYLIENPS